MNARVIIETDTDRVVIDLRVPDALQNDEGRVLAVLKASTVMGAALLDAEYLVQGPSEDEHGRREAKV